jgi:hypothetical protein
MVEMINRIGQTLGKRPLPSLSKAAAIDALLNHGRGLCPRLRHRPPNP